MSTDIQFNFVFNNKFSKESFEKMFRSARSNEFILFAPQWADSQDIRYLKLNTKQAVERVTKDYDNQEKKDDEGAFLTVRYKDTQIFLQFNHDQDRRILLYASPSAWMWNKDFDDFTKFQDINRYFDLLLNLLKSLCIKSCSYDINGGLTIEISDSSRPVVMADLHRALEIDQWYYDRLVSNVFDYDINVLSGNNQLNEEEFKQALWDHEYRKEVTRLSMIYKNHESIFEHRAGNIRIYPQQPYAMKECDGNEYIDCGFYLDLLSKLAERYLLFGLNTSGF
jgi:hypothetical protein